VAENTDTDTVPSLSTPVMMPGSSSAPALSTGLTRTSTMRPGVGVCPMTISSQAPTGAANRVSCAVWA
jgi:hypothetical protein